MPEIPKLVLGKWDHGKFLYLTTRNKLVRDNLRHVAIFKSENELKAKAKTLKIKDYFIMYYHEAKLAQLGMSHDIYFILREDKK